MYLIYLLGTFVLLFIGVTASFIDGQVHIDFAQIANYCDLSTFLFILIFCLLILLCTKSFKDFGTAFLLMSRNRKSTTEQYQRCYHAVKAVAITSIAAGGLRIVYTLVNLFRSMDGSVVSLVGYATITSLLSVFYPLVICILLIPVALSMKNAVKHLNR